MSESRVLLVGATGLVGRAVMERAVARRGVRLTALARRRIPLPQGARMEMFVADTSHWSETIDAVRPEAVICAIGTTWRKAGEDENEFRAVDQGLVLHVARAAKEAGARQFILVSSAGADRASRHLYQRVKAETEEQVAKLGFARLDILRPGLLKGRRLDDPRPFERLAMVLSPLLDLCLWGRFAAYRSIRADTVADAALSLVRQKPDGRFWHDGRSMMRQLQRG